MKTTLRLIALCLLACACSRNSSETIPVISWGGIPAENADAFYSLARECGFDYHLGLYRAHESVMKSMDAAARQGIRVIISHPHLKDSTEKVVAALKDHPALYAYHVKDEPEVSDFQWLNDVVEKIRTLDPDHHSYINIYFCLFEGTFRKYHEGEETLKTLPADAQPYTYYLEQAAAAADEFMKSSGYSLYTADTPETNYLNLFNKHKVSDGPNKEFILARNYDIQYGVVHSANASYQSATLGRPGLTRKLVASYLMKDGTSFTEKYKGQWETMQFVDETKDRDPRLAQSIRTPGYCRLGTTTPVAPQLSNTVTGYAPIKYLTGVEDDTYQTAYVDMPIFRTAEVYLNYAEAKAELGTITQADIDRSIKLIRARVGMPNLDVNVAADPYLLDKHSGYPKVAVKNSSNVGVILEIRRERTIELLQEGFRYYDIMRWAEGSTFETPLYGMYFPGEGTYDLNADGTDDLTLYKGEKPAKVAALAYNLGVENKDGVREGAEITLSEGDKGHIEFHKNTRPGWEWDTVKDYYYPIPVGDRNLTGGALTQNPGWNDGLSF